MLASSRLSAAGATTEELERIESDYDSATLGEQAGQEQYFAKRADGDLAEWLDAQRASGRFDVAEATEDLTALNKPVLIERAEKLGIDVPSMATKADIVELLEAHQPEAVETD